MHVLLPNASCDTSFLCYDLRNAMSMDMEYMHV